MNKTDMELRLSLLTAQQQSLKEQFSSNYNAYSGAIEECKFWLSQFPADVPSNNPVAPVAPVADVAAAVDENPDAALSIESIEPTASTETDQTTEATETIAE